MMQSPLALALSCVLDNYNAHMLAQCTAKSSLRVQCHAHACIFGWLLGDCISETTADIPRNQRPMLQDWRRLYTLQTMSAESARRKRDGRG